MSPKRTVGASSPPPKLERSSSASSALRGVVKSGFFRSLADAEDEEGGLEPNLLDTIRIKVEPLMQTTGGSMIQKLNQGKGKDTGDKKALKGGEDTLEGTKKCKVM
jgi:hypothetical protein